MSCLLRDIFFEFCIMNYTKIGKIVAAHGLKGEVILVHHLGKKSNLPNIKTIFIEDNHGSLVPWFIEKASCRTTDETIIKFEEINSREGTKQIYPKNAWLKEEDFQSIVAKDAPIALLDYVIMEDNKEIGIIQEVIEQTHQILCVVDYKGKEAYIPLHEKSLLNIDRKKKIVHVKLPEGLLDVYTD